MHRPPGNYLQWRVAVLGLLMLGHAPATFSSRAAEGYLKAPEPIGELLSAPPPPTVLFNLTRDRMLVQRTERHPPLADLAEPLLRLAGLRINPVNNGPHRTVRCLDLGLQTMPDGKEYRIR